MSWRGVIWSLAWGALLALPFVARANEIFDGLSGEIDAIAERSPGTHLSVYAILLETGAVFDYDGQRAVGPVGTLRLHLFIQAYRRAAARKLDLSKQVAASSVAVRTGPGLLRLLPSVSMNLHDYATAMIVQNESLATAVLLNEVGADSVNQTIEEFGLTETTVELNRATIDGVEMERWQRASSARDAALTLQRIATGTALDPAGTDRLMAALTYPKPSFLRFVFPREASVANIVSIARGIRSEAAIVTLGSQRLIVSMVSQRSRGRMEERDGSDAMNEVARALATRFVGATQPATPSSSSN